MDHRVAIIAENSVGGLWPKGCVFISLHDGLDVSDMVPIIHVPISPILEGAVFEGA